MSRRFFRRLTDPRRRDRARFLGDIFAALNRAFQEEAEQSGLTKAEIAKRLGVHRSVITRRLSGQGNMTFETLHDMAWAMGRRVTIALPPRQASHSSNSRPNIIGNGPSASRSNQTFSSSAEPLRLPNNP